MELEEVAFPIQQLCEMNLSEEGAASVVTISISGNSSTDYWKVSNAQVL